MNTQTAVSYLTTHFDQHLAQLSDFLSIPSISTLSEHRGDIDRAAAWLLAEAQRVGLENGEILQTDGHPIVYADWLHAGADVPTVLLYGHYDVQPPGDLALWHYEPFTPTLTDDRIYARGASDNKAQHFSHLKAIEALLTENGRLPINIKLCLDGEEEIGSPNLEPFVKGQRERLACDLILCSDGPMVSSSEPTVEYGLRGVLDAELIVRGPKRDLHSGNYGGSVHNPIQALSDLLAKLHNSDGTVAIPGFYDGIPALTDEERDILAKVPYPLENWQKETGAPKPWGDPTYTFYERITVRPTCELNGIWGGFQGEGMRTIIPPEAGAKISFRLVEGQDWRRIGQLFRDYIAAIAPDTIRYDLHVGTGANVALTPFDSVPIRAALAAYEEGWGETAVLNRAGGSLPIIATFQSELNAPFVLMPFGLDDNRHSPNEHYLLEHLRRGCKTAVVFYHILAKKWQSG